MKLYLKSGQVIEINGVSEVSYNVYEHGKLIDSNDYVEYNKLDKPIFKRDKFLRDCQDVREDNELVSELISFYDDTGYLKFSTFMDQIIGIEED